MPIKRLAIITTHPIQYYAPVFRLLHQRGIISIKVYYTWGEQAMDKYDPGFGQKIAWDIPLTDGYPFEWVLNIAKDPGTHHFNGIVNPDLSARVMDWRPDAVLYIGWAYKGHLKSMNSLKGKIPVYFRGDSTLLDNSLGITAFFKSVFLKWVYRHVDYAFYVGSNNKAYFLKYGLKKSQLAFAPHAVDNPRFATVRKKEADMLRASLNIDQQAVLILFAGKLEEKKSPLLLLDAFLTWAPSHAHLLFVGNGAQEAELKARSAGDGRVHFADFRNQSEIPVYYQAADLFCLPSRGPGETWGLAVNEAMACGKAIVVSDKVGCATDLVKENYNGWIFNSRDKAALGRILEKMARDKEMLRFFGHNSYELIQEWSFIHIAEAIENKLNEKI